MVQDAIDPAALRRVLVIKLRHLGDVLLTTPVFTVLKNRAPHAEIDALVYADTREMLSGHPAISMVHTVERHGKEARSPWKRIAQEWRLLQALRARRYDLLVHLTENPRGAWLAVLLGVPYAVVRDYRPRRGRLWHAVFSHRYRIPARPRHTVEIHLDALRRIGIQPGYEERRLVLAPGEEAQAAAAKILRAQGLAPEGFLHVHPTSRWMFKSWKPERFAELINRLQDRGERVVLTAAPDPEERKFVADITARLRKPVVDLSGQLSLKELAALTAQAKCFVGVDSLPMHIAAAMQTPVVVLFGPSGDLEWGPWMVRSTVITSGHSCRPCGLDGCGQGKVSECLTAITVDEVLRAVQELLAA